MNKPKFQDFTKNEKTDWRKYSIALNNFIAIQQKVIKKYRAKNKEETTPDFLDEFLSGLKGKNK